MQRLSLSDSTIEDWNYNSNQNAFSILTIKSSEDVILQEIMAMVLLFLLSILGWLQSFFWGEDDIGPGQSIAACEVPDKNFPLAPGKGGNAIRALIFSGGQSQGLKRNKDISWGYCFPNKIICLFVSGMSSLFRSHSKQPGFFLWRVLSVQQLGELMVVNGLIPLCLQVFVWWLQGVWADHYLP